MQLHEQAKKRKEKEHVLDLGTRTMWWKNQKQKRRTNPFPILGMEYGEQTAVNESSNVMSISSISSWVVNEEKENKQTHKSR